MFELGPELQLTGRLRAALAREVACSGAKILNRDSRAAQAER